jgi:hypothetical protein
MTYRPELGALAQLARATLAEASAPTLLIEGIELPRLGDPVIVLGDRAGQPTFLCGAGSPVTEAAREARRAVLTVPSPDGGRLVTFAGRLRCVDVEHVGVVPVDIVGMAPLKIVVEEAGGAREVPLDLYLRAGSDPLEAYAARVLEHTNRAHHDDLRRVAAAHVGVPLGQIAAAALAELDGAGGQLRWVDRAGAHSSTITFPEQASTPQHLADMLGGYLRGVLQSKNLQSKNIEEYR